jgi:hypothetical protein
MLEIKAGGLSQASKPPKPEDMIFIPCGTFRMGSDKRYPFIDGTP